MSHRSSKSQAEGTISSVYAEELNSFPIGGHRMVNNRKTENIVKSNPTGVYVGRPGGVIQQRVRQVGGEKFGIVAVDCAEAFSDGSCPT